MASPPTKGTPATALELVRASLAQWLSAEEVTQLLKNSQFIEPLTQALRPYDGEDDYIEVDVSADELRIRVLTQTKRQTCAWERRSELAQPRLRCQDEYVEQQRHTIALGTEARREQPAPQAPRRTSAPRVSRRTAEEPTANPRDRQPAETAAALLRRIATQAPVSEWCRLMPNDLQCRTRSLTTEAAVAPPSMAALLGAYSDLLDTVRTAVRDPLVRSFGIGPAEMIAPSISADAASSKCIFEIETTPEDAMWAPTLECFRSAISHNRLERDGPYQFLRFAEQWLQITNIAGVWSILRDLRARKKLPSHEQIALLWAQSWLGWVKATRPRLSKAIASLGVAERQVLRRVLYRWWQQEAYVEFRSLFTLLIEEHLLAFYPEMRGTNGLPQRTHFTSDFLWATNWMAAQRHAKAPELAAVFAKLPATDQALLRALLPHWGHRFSTVATVVIR